MRKILSSHRFYASLDGVASSFASSQAFIFLSLPICIDSISRSIACLAPRSPWDVLSRPAGSAWSCLDLGSSRLALVTHFRTGQNTVGERERKRERETSK